MSGGSGSIEARLKEAAKDLGFSLVGVTLPRESDHSAFYQQWIDDGAHGEMAYLARPDAVARRADLSLTLPTVRSVIVVAHDYFVENTEEHDSDPSRGIIARYARGRDYHKVLRSKLLRLLAFLGEAANRPVEGRAYVDTGPILERELGARAGFGWFGRNTVLIHPRRGSWFFLGCLLVDLDLEPDAPFTEDHCGTCNRCVEACPTGALLGRDADGAPVLDARLCISYLTIELRGPIPRELRPAVGNRVFGCDICQEVCPFTRSFAKPTSEPAFAARGPGEAPHGVEPQGLPASRPHPGTAAPSLVDLMALGLEAWDDYSRGSALRRAGRSGFLRSVAVALGNWRSPEAVPVLIAALSEADPLVRGHAAWALGVISVDKGTMALRAALGSEADAWVRSEMESALAASDP